MKIVIRVDASLEMGTGHVMRCLTLAEALKTKETDITFICRKHQGNLITRIQSQGFTVHTLEVLNGSNQVENGKNSNLLLHANWLGVSQQQDAEQCSSILENIKPDWLIVDHYALDKTWQNLLKIYYKKLMVIDDLADRAHLCDLLLDQTYGRQTSDYQNLVPKTCEMLLESQYALLRSEFAQWREYSLKRRIKPEFKNILITMGGVDADNVTSQVLNAISGLQFTQGIELNVVMGETAPHLSKIKEQAKAMPYKTNVLLNVDNMAEIMSNADLAIGAAGATTWERCCLGLPSIILMLAKNQGDIVALLTKFNVALVMNKESLNRDAKIIEEISVSDLIVLSQASAQLLDGDGSSRVSKLIKGLI